MRDANWSAENPEQLRIDPLRPSPKIPILGVHEQLQTTTRDVHPSWIRATSIFLLKGIERLRQQEGEGQFTSTSSPPPMDALLLPYCPCGSCSRK